MKVVVNRLAAVSPGSAIQNAERESLTTANPVASFLQATLAVIVVLLLLGVAVLYSLSKRQQIRLENRKTWNADANVVDLSPQPETTATTDVSDAVVLPVDQIPDQLLEPQSDSSPIPRAEFEETVRLLMKNMEALSSDGRKRDALTDDSTREKLRIYCANHRFGFHVSRGGRDIVCPLGGHVIGRNFPYGSDWVFCCDCSRFSLVSDSEEPGAKACPSCERSLVQMYSCDRCHVLSAESRTLTGNKYKTGEQGISPFCPGCLSSPPAKLWNHQCARSEAELISAFLPCRWCNATPPV